MDKPVNVAFILPSRGLVHSRTIESILINKDVDDEIFISNDNPIPECFNIPIDLAIRSPRNFTHIFIVEEDIVLKDDTLESLLKADVDVAAADYALGDGSRVTSEYAGYKMSGTGCILIKREAMLKLLPFSSKNQYNVANMEVYNELDDEHKTYGMQDIDMWIRAQKAGMSIAIVGEVKHLKVTQMGEKGKNDGFHIIEELK